MIVVALSLFCVVAVCCVWLDIDISGYRSEKRKRTARRFLLLPGRHVIRRRAQVEAAQVPERTGVVEAGAREQALPNRRTKSSISTKGSSISISSKYTQTDGQRIENRKPSVEAKILRRSQVLRGVLRSNERGTPPRPRFKIFHFLDENGRPGGWGRPINDQ